MKTAVKWIEGYLKKFNHIQESLSLRKAFEQAKEMEKEQIINAFNYGQVDLGMEADEYYNNNFKSE